MDLHHRKLVLQLVQYFAATTEGSQQGLTFKILYWTDTGSESVIPDHTKQGYLLPQFSLVTLPVVNQILCLQLLKEF